MRQLEVNVKKEIRTEALRGRSIQQSLRDRQPWFCPFEGHWEGDLRNCIFMLSSRSFLKPKILRFEDQIKTFPYFFRGFTIGKIVTGSLLEHVPSFSSKNIEASKAAFIELQSKRYVRYKDLPLDTKNEQHIDAEFVSNVYLVNHHKVIQCNIRHITERKLKLMRTGRR